MADKKLRENLHRAKQRSRSDDPIPRRSQPSDRREGAGRAAAARFFGDPLSDEPIFRRASDMVVGKSGPESFLYNLINKPSPFISRVSEDIAVALLNDCALITLIVVGTKAAIGADQYARERQADAPRAYLGKGNIGECLCNDASPISDAVRRATGNH